MSLESETWKFRTRVGVYRLTQSDANSSRIDNLLRDKIKCIKDSVPKWSVQRISALLRSYFCYAICCCGYCRRICRAICCARGAYTCCRDEVLKLAKLFAWCCSTPAPTSAEEAVDLCCDEKDSDHEDEETGTLLSKPVHGATKTGNGNNNDVVSPAALSARIETVSPEVYVKYRIKVVHQFYAKRVGPYEFSSIICRSASGVGALAGFMIAWLWSVQVAAIVSIAVGSVMAWTIFQCTESKVTRFQNVKSALENHLIDWERLKPAEKCAVANIEELVLKCEEILRGQMEAWFTSAKAQSKLLSKSSKPDEQGSMQGGSTGLLV